MRAVAILWRSGFLFATLGPAERAAKVAAARKRIEAAEQKRRDAKRQRDAKAAKRRGKS